ncbi:unnamed protein product, partial [Polarella glacialis]
GDSHFPALDWPRWISRRFASKVPQLFGWWNQRLALCRASGLPICNAPEMIASMMPAALDAMYSRQLQKDNQLRWASSGSRPDLGETSLALMDAQEESVEAMNWVLQGKDLAEGRGGGQINKPGVYRSICLEVNLRTKVCICALLHARFLSDMEGGELSRKMIRKVAPTSGEVQSRNLDHTSEASVTSLESLVTMVQEIAAVRDEKELEIVALRQSWACQSVAAKAALQKAGIRADTATDNDDEDFVKVLVGAGCEDIHLATKLEELRTEHNAQLQLLDGLYGWLASPTSLLYDAALLRRVHQYMDKVLQLFVSVLKKNGCKVIHASYSKVLFETGKLRVVPDIQVFCEALCQNVQTQKALEPLDLNEAMPQANLYYGVIWLDPSDWAGIPIDPESGAVLWKVQSCWKLADFLPPAVRPSLLLYAGDLLLGPQRELGRRFGTCSDSRLPGEEAAGRDMEVDAGADLEAPGCADGDGDDDEDRDEEMAEEEEAPSDAADAAVAAADRSPNGLPLELLPLPHLTDTSAAGGADPEAQVSKVLEVEIRTFVQEDFFKDSPQLSAASEGVAQPNGQRELFFLDSHGACCRGRHVSMDVQSISAKTRGSRVKLEAAATADHAPRRKSYKSAVTVKKKMTEMTTTFMPSMPGDKSVSGGAPFGAEVELPGSPWEDGSFWKAPPSSVDFEFMRAQASSKGLAQSELNALIQILMLEECIVDQATCLDFESPCFPLILRLAETSRIVSPVCVHCERNYDKESDEASTKGEGKGKLKDRSCPNVHLDTRIAEESVRFNRAKSSYSAKDGMQARLVELLQSAVQAWQSQEITCKKYAIVFMRTVSRFSCANISGAEDYALRKCRPSASALADIRHDLPWLREMLELYGLGLRVEEAEEEAPGTEQKKPKKSKKETSNDAQALPEATSGDKKGKKDKKDKKAAFEPSLADKQAKNRQLHKEGKQTKKEKYKAKLKAIKAEADAKKAGGGKLGAARLEEEALKLAGMESLDPNAVECFVTGLPYMASDKHVTEHFARVGPCKVKLLMDAATNRASGKAFLTFETAQLALRACTLDKSKIQNRWISVRLATPRASERTAELTTRPDDCLSAVVTCEASTSEASLWKFFEDCQVSGVSLMTDKATGEFRGMAFLDFEEGKMVDKAVQKSAQTLKGKTILVRYKR